MQEIKTDLFPSHLYEQKKKEMVKNQENGSEKEEPKEIAKTDEQ